MALHSFQKDSSMIRFSKSKLNTYISCPEKYYAFYELRMRSHKASKTLVEGSAIHRIVEEGLITGDSTSDHLDDVSHRFWEANPFERCDYESVEQYQAAQELCLWQSRQFLELLGPLPTSQTELEMRSDLIHPITGEVNDQISMLGYLDLVLIREDGTPLLADLKTVGRSPREGMSKVALELSFYAYMYSLLIEENMLAQFPVALIYLIRTKEPKIHWDESVRSLPHFVELYEICSKVSENIHQGCFWKNCGMHCSWCACASLCYGLEAEALSTFGEDQWHRYLLDLHQREQALITFDQAANF